MSRSTLLSNLCSGVESLPSPPEPLVTRESSSQDSSLPLRTTTVCTGPSPSTVFLTGGPRYRPFLRHTFSPTGLFPVKVPVSPVISVYVLFWSPVICLFSGVLNHYCFSYYRKVSCENLEKIHIFPWEKRFCSNFRCDRISIIETNIYLRLM